MMEKTRISKYHITNSKKRLIKLFKKHCFTIMIVLSLFMYMIGYASIHRDMTETNLEVEDIAGDRKYMQDVTICGVIADELHRREFTIQNGVASSRFLPSSDQYIRMANKVMPENMPLRLRHFIEPSQDATVRESYSKKYGMATTLSMDKADVYYKVSGNSGLEIIFRTEMAFYSPERKIWVSKSSLEGNLYGDNVFESMGYEIWNGEDLDVYRIKRTEDGRTFVYTCSGKDCRGWGGAYEITEYLTEGGNDIKMDLTSGISLPNVAPIDLKEGRVEIFGMETVGEKLVFLLRDQNNVILRPFDLSENRFLEDKYVSTRSTTPENVNLRYFFDRNDGYLSIAFPYWNMEESDLNLGKGQNSNVCRFIVYDGNNDNVIKNGEESIQDDWSHEIMLHDMVMKYKNDKLYVISKIDEFIPLAMDGKGRTYEPRVAIGVYGKEKDGALYKGFISSNVIEDYRYTGEETVPFFPNIRNENLYFRNYYNLSME